MSKLMMLQLCLFWMNFIKAEVAGQIVFALDNTRVYFSDSDFYGFYDCMRNKNRECTAHSDWYSYWYKVNEVQPSGNILTGNRYYVCTITNLNRPTLKCTANLTTDNCLKRLADCIKDRVGVVLQTNNVYVSGENIMNCSVLCSNNFRTLYYGDGYTTKSATVPTIISTETTYFASSIPSSTPASINTTLFYPSKTTLTFPDKSSANVSGLLTNKDKIEDSTATTIIISVCAVGAVVLILCSVIAICVWRRHRNYQKSNSNNKTSHKYTSELKNTTSSKRGKEIEHATNTKETTEDPPDLVKTGLNLHVKEYINYLAGTDYTTIAEGGVKQVPSTGHENLDHYANTMTISSNSIEYEWEVKQGQKSENINQESQPGKLCSNFDSTVDYNNSAESTSSEYRRLGQERSDLKNPYQHLLEEEQQPVMSDQELSPYSLAKPVFGETTVQVIDVGKSLFKVCDARATSGEDQPYNNTPNDGEIQHVAHKPQREPTVNIQRDCLDYTMILPVYRQ